MKLSEIFTSFQKWLDGEDGMAVAGQPRVTSNEWDEFFVTVAREVEAVMKREMFTPPGGPTYLPVEYIVSLSREDNEEWHGRKREGLLDGLRHVLAGRARELVGDKVLKNDRIALTLGVDGTLDRGQVRVRAVWDEDSPRTEVSVRRRKDSGVEPRRSGELDPPPNPLFLVRWRRDDESAIYSAYKTRIEIGRGSKDFPTDLRLAGDQEISRRHALLERLDGGEYRLECVGRNPIDVAGRDLGTGERLDLTAGASFRIGKYVLTIEETAP